MLIVNGGSIAITCANNCPPIKAAELADTLYEFRTKAKSSPLMQMADLYLWPICMGGYDPQNRPYARLIEDRKLIDCTLEPEQVPALGIKYSCWELAAASTVTLTVAMSVPPFPSSAV